MPHCIKNCTVARYVYVVDMAYELTITKVQLIMKNSNVDQLTYWLLGPEITSQHFTALSLLQLASSLIVWAVVNL